MLPAIECLVLLIVLAAAWVQRGALPLVPTADPDTWGYLRPALCWLSGLGLQQTDGRDWLYPALLGFFLKTTGSFAGIVIWQRFLAIGSGILMAITWRCWVAMLPLRKPARFFVTLAGSLPILVQLMNPQSVYFETSIRPEALLPFFVYAQLACLMGYYRYRWLTAKTLPSILLGAAAILLSYACFLLKPSWLLAFALTSAPVFAGLTGRAPSFTARLLAPSLGIVLSLFLWLPSRTLLIQDSTSRTFLPATLFTVHARLIAASLEAKLAKMPEADPEKIKLAALVDVLTKELHLAEDSRSGYKKLGFDPDYLYYRSTLIPAIDTYTGHDGEKFRSFCDSSLREAALHAPLAYGRKVLAQFTYFLFPGPETFYKDREDYPKFYLNSSADLPAELPDAFRAGVREMYLRYRADLAAEAKFSPRLKSNFHSLRQVIAPLAPLVEILFLLTFAACFHWAPLREMRLCGWAAASLFSAPFGNALTVCMVHALDVERYRVTYGGFLLFALAALAVFLGFVIGRYRRLDKPRRVLQK